MPVGVYERSQATRDAVSKRFTGVPLTEEHKRNISKAQKGVSKSEEHKANSKAAINMPGVQKAKAKKLSKTLRDQRHCKTTTAVQTKKRQFNGRAAPKYSWTKIAREYLNTGGLEQLCEDARNGLWKWKEFSSIKAYYRHIWTYANVMSKKELYSLEPQLRAPVWQIAYDMAIEVTNRHGMDEFFRDKKKEV